MFRWFKNWRRRRVLRDNPISDAEWQQALADVPLAAACPPALREALREQVTLFLDEKDFYGADGLNVGRRMALQVATQA